VSAITRSWIAFAAVGAGLIHLALVISAPLAGGILLAGIGIAEFAWGVLVMFDESFLVPRIAVVAALAPVALWVMALALGVQSFRPVPLAVATLFELFIAIAIAVSLRRNRVAVPSSTGRYVIGLVVAALVIGTLTATALAATTTVANSTLFDDGTHH
jgi:hypothetical protein